MLPPFLHNEKKLVTIKTELTKISVDRGIVKYSIVTPCDIQLYASIKIVMNNPLKAMSAFRLSGLMPLMVKLRILFGIVALL